MSFCITGMHRSGTSVVAHALACCGVYLGPEEELVPADQWNADGYWENPRLVRLSDSLLAELGGGWDLPPSPSESRRRKVYARFAPAGRAALESLAVRDLWGWKDPRTSLLADFWSNIAPDLRFVVCVRNPLEVGLSLQRRGLMSPVLGMSLWATYYERLLETTSRSSRIVVEYGAFVSDPAGCLESLVAKLGIDLTEAQLRGASAVVDPVQRHHGAAPLHGDFVPPAVTELYVRLLAESANRPAPDTGGTSSQLPLPATVVRSKGSALLELSELYQQALAVNQDRDRWRERADIAEQERASVDEQLEAALAAATEADAQREALERRIEETRGAAAELERQLHGELQQRTLERDNWIRGAGEYEQDRDRWRERAASSEHEQVALNQRLEAALAAAESAQAQREISERETEDARKAADRLQGELEQRTFDRDSWSGRANEYEQDRDQWRERTASADQERASLSARLEAALAAIETQREIAERETEAARRVAEEVQARLQAELAQRTEDRDGWSTRASEFERDRDHWRERTANAEQERESLSARLEAALAAIEAQREVWERESEVARRAAEQVETRLQAELDQRSQERDHWRERTVSAEQEQASLSARLEAALAGIEAQREISERKTEEARTWSQRAGEYERDRDHWRERVERLSARLEAALGAAAAAEAQREVSERATEAARDAAEQLEMSLQGELQRLTLEGERLSALAEQHEQDRDRWRERATTAEQEQAGLDAQLEAAKAAAAEAEAQREAAERGARDLALERDHARRAATEYEQDRDRWRERADRTEQERIALSQRLEVALAAVEAAEAPGALTRKWRALSQFGSWLSRGRLGYARQYFALRGSFDQEAYLAANSDVAAAGLHPLLHYIEHGAVEGRALARTPSEEESRPSTATPPGEPLEPDATPEFIVASVERAGLVDDDFYRAEYPEVEESELTPAQHYCLLGWREGRWPNAYFDPEWYAKTYPDTTLAGTNPLWDYVVTGETRRPCVYFDPSFYASRYGLPSTNGALADFLAHRKRREWRDPVELFDTGFYLSRNQDVAASGDDPFLHYLHTGHREARDPSPTFSTLAYRATHLKGRLEVNPLVDHYEALLSGVPTDPPPGRLSTTADDVRRMVQPGPDFEEFDPQIADRAAPRAKAIAFYLPQFHAIPENDEWWGKGFTEWSNVARGLPRFAGHYQPRLPRDLGFYDLGREDVLPRQVDLARAAGIHGFSFYYYWFDGKRLLEQPVERFLSDPAIDFPFCLTWANENWTRRWDGHDDEVLIAQRYDPDCDVALVDNLQRHFADPRYIRLQGRPLFLLYRADSIPEAARRIERWRELWQSRHGEEPLIFVAQAFGSVDPRAFGLDGAFEFPPHKLVEELQPINSDLTILDPAFGGHVVAYEDVVDKALAEPLPEYPFIRTAVPSWDNDARRQGQGLTLHGSTPALYERWLRALADSAEKSPVLGEPLVFVNAWNEWAEAAYLEPDVHQGAGYLNATARALADGRTATKRKVLLVGHDAHRHGAQMILLHIGETLSSQFGCEVAWLLLAGGAMVAEYERFGPVSIADGDASQIAETVAALRLDGFELALTNTALTGAAVTHLKEAGFHVMSLIHELPGVIKEFGAEESLATIVEQCDTVVAPAQNVADAIVKGTSPEMRGRIVVRPQGLYTELSAPQDARARLRSRLGIDADSRIVLNVGFADLRKGVDTFVQIGKLATAQTDDLHFVWAGNVHRDARHWVEEDLSGRIHFLPFTDDLAELYFGADAFFLSSREDPFPSVVLEAMSSGLPVVALRGASGMEDLIAQHGRLVERDDTPGLVQVLAEAVREDDEQSRAARALVVAQQFRYDDYCFDLLLLLEPKLEKVSVVVPNYNYARYLEGRMRSIFDQTYPVFETIVLDDHSTDDSLARLEDIAQTSRRRFRIVANDENSGSPFAQWERGCRLARGKYVWVAEADDESEARFLEEVVALQRSDGASFAFSDSVPIDEKGVKLADSYKDYYRGAVGALMDSSFVVDGKAFVQRCLTERNLVLNASAVVWKRETLLDALASCCNDLPEYRLAGDWYLYATAALSAPRVAYVSTPLNVHRRHDSSVTASLNGKRHVEEVERVQSFVGEALGDDAAARRRRRAYADRLRDQFGVTIDHESSN